MPIQTEIRRHIQTQRQSLSCDQQSKYSAQICQQIINSGVLDQAQHIAFYLPVRGEADPTSLQLIERYQGKRFYLPVLSEVKPNHFHVYDSKFRFRKSDAENRYEKRDELPTFFIE